MSTCTHVHRRRWGSRQNEKRVQLEHMCTAPVLMRLLVSGTATTTVTSTKHTHTQSSAHSPNTHF